MEGNTGESLQLCYNKGCGQKFNPTLNKQDSCTYHAGEPFFHDAYKGWSCCNKRCTDFTEFLNIKGCTTSFHSNVKPVTPVKEKPDETTKDEVIVYEAPKVTRSSVVVVERPSEDVPMTKLPTTVSTSLKELLLQQRTRLNDSEKKITTDNSNSEIEIGTSCKNGACKKVFQGESSNSETCAHHPGVPIFHEGLKFWTCCKKKTTDFNTFLEQEGCTTGSHLWTKTESEQKTVDCRHDWHQTGSHVVVSVYAKGCEPNKTYVEANPVKLHVVVATYGSDNIFDKEFLLQEVIDVDSSNVSLAATKMEIKLKKAGPVIWKNLSVT